MDEERMRLAHAWGYLDEAVKQVVEGRHDVDWLRKHYEIAVQYESGEKPLPRTVIWGDLLKRPPLPTD